MSMAPMSLTYDVKNTFINCDVPIHYDVDDLPTPTPALRSRSAPCEVLATCCCLQTPSLTNEEQEEDDWDGKSVASFASTASGFLQADADEEDDSESTKGKQHAKSTCQQAAKILFCSPYYVCQAVCSLPVLKANPFLDTAGLPLLTPPQEAMAITSGSYVQPSVWQPAVQESQQWHEYNHSEQESHYKDHTSEVPLFKHIEPVGIEESDCADGFKVVKRLIGPRGQFMKHISDESNGAKVWISGRGACRKANHATCQKGKDCMGPLSICVSALSESSYEIAVELVKELLQRVHNDYHRHLSSTSSA